MCSLAFYSFLCLLPLFGLSTCFYFLKNFRLTFLCPSVLWLSCLSWTCYLCCVFLYDLFVFICFLLVFSLFICLVFFVTFHLCLHLWHPLLCLSFPFFVLICFCGTPFLLCPFRFFCIFVVSFLSLFIFRDCLSFLTSCLYFVLLLNSLSIMYFLIFILCFSYVTFFYVCFCDFLDFFGLEQGLGVRVRGLSTLHSHNYESGAMATAVGPLSPIPHPMCTIGCCHY